MCASYADGLLTLFCKGLEHRRGSCNQSPQTQREGCKGLPPSAAIRESWLQYSRPRGFSHQYLSSTSKSFDCARTAQESRQVLHARPCCHTSVTANNRTVGPSLTGWPSRPPRRHTDGRESVKTAHCPCTPTTAHTHTPGVSRQDIQYALSSPSLRPKTGPFLPAEYGEAEIKRVHFIHICPRSTFEQRLKHAAG